MNKYSKKIAPTITNRLILDYHNNTKVSGGSEDVKEVSYRIDELLHNFSFKGKININSDKDDASIVVSQSEGIDIISDDEVQKNITLQSGHNLIDLSGNGELTIKGGGNEMLKLGHKDGNEINSNGSLNITSKDLTIDAVNINQTSTKASYIYAGTADYPQKMEIGSKGKSYIQFNKDATAKAYGDYTFKGATTFEKPVNIKEINRDGTLNVNASDIKLNTEEGSYKIYEKLKEIDGQIYFEKEIEVEEEVPDTDAYVDLGIISDDGSPLYFATCNIGATNPEEDGDYFMWGSVTPNTDDVCDWAHAPFNNGASSFDSTYFNAHKSEWFDSGILKPEYDAAHVIMGDGWRMPTYSELHKLRMTPNIWTTENGVYGRKFESINDSSKYIFIPASGLREKSSLKYKSSISRIWGSSYNTSDPECADSLDSDKLLAVTFTDGDRWLGCSVRAVTTTIPTKTIKVKKTVLVPLKDVVELLDLKIGNIDTVLDNIIGG